LTATRENDDSGGSVFIGRGAWESGEIRPEEKAQPTKCKITKKEGINQKKGRQKLLKHIIEKRE